MANNNDTSRPINVLDAFENEPPPLDLVLPGMIAGTVGALVSPGGAGKSMFALQLAAAVAGGPDVLEVGIPATGPVAYLPAEDPALAIRHRLHALGAHVPAPLREIVDEKLLIWPLMGKAPDLLAPIWQRAIKRMAEDRRLLILDTLRRYHSGDENSSGDMAKVLAIMEAICGETGVSILFLHHSSKALAVSGQGDMQQASRGSSVLVDNVRGGQYNLIGMTKNEAEDYGLDESDRGFYVRLCQSKANFGPPSHDRWLHRTKGGILVPVELEKKPKKGKGKGGAQSEYSS